MSIISFETQYNLSFKVIHAPLKLLTRTDCIVFLSWIYQQSVWVIKPCRAVFKNILIQIIMYFMSVSIISFMTCLQLRDSATEAAKITWNSPVFHTAAFKWAAAINNVLNNSERLDLKDPGYNQRLDMHLYKKLNPFWVESACPRRAAVHILRSGWYLIRRPVFLFSTKVKIIRQTSDYSYIFFSISPPSCLSSWGIDLEGGETVSGTIESELGGGGGKVHVPDVHDVLDI